MAGIADAGRVDAFATQAANDVRGLLAGGAGGNITRVTYSSGWPTRPTKTKYVDWVDPTGTATAPAAAIFGDVVFIGSTVLTSSAPPPAVSSAVSGAAQAVAATYGTIATVVTPPTFTRFFDTFTNPLANQWTTYLGGISLNAGRVSISTTGVVGGDYPAIETKEKYRLTGAGYAANMVQTLPRTGNYETQIETGLDYANNAGFMLFAYGFYGYITTNGVRAEFTLPAYNPTTHKWWRVREKSGSIYFDTSPDGVSWTNHTYGPHSWSTESVYMIIKCGYWGTALPAQNILCDEVSLIAETTV